MDRSVKPTTKRIKRGAFSSISTSQINEKSSKRPLRKPKLEISSIENSKPISSEKSVEQMIDDLMESKHNLTIENSSLKQIVKDKDKEIKLYKEFIQDFGCLVFSSFDHLESNPDVHTIRILSSQLMRKLKEIEFKR